MLSEEEVLEQFRGKARLADGDIYLAQDDVSALVNVCQENDLAVLGLEGGTHDGKNFLPNLDMILDCSLDGPLTTWEEKRDICNRSALDFLESLARPEDLLLIPVLMSREQWDEWRASEDT